MKSTIKFAGLFFILTCTLLTMMDIQSVSARQDEVEEALRISLRNVLKASNEATMYEMSEQDMKVEFIRYFADNVNTDSAFDIYFYEASKQGLLDVQITNRFLHHNGKNGQREIRKTLLLEEVSK